MQAEAEAEDGRRQTIESAAAVGVSLTLSLPTAASQTFLGRRPKLRLQ
jgi:hypothetical protein